MRNWPFRVNGTLAEQRQPSCAQQIARIAELARSMLILVSVTILMQFEKVPL